VKKELKQGQRMPTGYGISYRDWDADKKIIYPIPINLVVRIYREIHWHIMRGLFPLTIDRIQRNIRTLEYGRGYYDGYEDGKRSAKQEVKA
jgi:hypothetical protein